MDNVLELIAAEWKRCFEDSEKERLELADVMHALRSGQVDSIRSHDESEVRMLRLQDAKLVEENERLLEAFKQQSEELQQQNVALKTTHIEQQRSEETVRVLLDSQSVSSMLVDPAGKILASNQMAAQQLQKKENELVGHSLYSLLPDHLRGESKRRIKEVCESGRAVQFEEKDQDEVFNIHLFPIQNSLKEISRIAIFSHDITEEYNNKQKLIQMANFDSLTGLGNRTLFYSHQKAQIALAARNKQPLATLFLDLDNFKEVNDTWGHDAGDQLLQSVAQRIRGCLRDSDVVARLGGDEFAVLLSEIKRSSDAAIVAQKILDELALPHKLDVHEIFSSVSIGIACYPENGDNLEELNIAADTAMYYAKRNGRNRYHYYDSNMQQQNLEKISLVDGLRQSVKKNELSVHYQPMVRAGDKKIVGVEALARWHSRETDPVDPSIFIPLAEEIGLMDELGDWILCTACQDAKQMQKQLANAGYSDFSVAVNISPRQLRSFNFTETLKKALNKSELPAQCLQIELTEKTIMENPETAIEILGAIRELGVRIAIDDFGTGYFSLSYLSRLPIDTLKIDLSFVQAIGQTAEGEAVIKSIFALAQTLGLETVAEGVESKAQIDFLCRLGCTYLQGYYFGEPAERKHIGKMIALNIS